MNTGTELSTIAATLEHQRAIKRDFIAPTNFLTVEPNCAIITVGDKGGFQMDHHFHSQLAEFTKIPKPYYDRMLECQPTLYAASVNTWLRATPARRMIRTVYPYARAFLSDAYRPLDNIDMLASLLPAFESSQLEIRSSALTDTRMYLKATTPKLEGEVKKGDVIRWGVYARNSEVGDGAWDIGEFIERLVCLNGMIGESLIRRSHVGRRIGGEDEATEFYKDDTRRADDKAFFLRVRDTVQAVLSPQRFQAYLTKARGAAQQQIEAPLEIVELVAKDYGLSDVEKGAVLRNLVNGKELSRWGLANALTRTADDATSYERATEFEKLGHTILELPKTAWERLAA